MVKLVVIIVEVTGSIHIKSSNLLLPKRGATWHHLIGSCNATSVYHCTPHHHATVCHIITYLAMCHVGPTTYWKGCHVVSCGVSYGVRLRNRTYCRIQRSETYAMA